MKKMLKFISILFFLTIGIVQVFAQEYDPLQSKYPEVFKMNPLTFDMTELAQVNIADLKAEAYLLLLDKQYEKAAKFYLYIISRNYEDATSAYELAKCYAYLDQANYAANFLILAINNGYNNFSKIKEEEAFLTLQQNPVFYNQFKEVLASGKDLGQTIYVKGEKVMKCRIMLPEDYDANKSYPLLIGMHGFGGTTEDFTKVWTDMNTHSFIFVIPEGPYDAFPNSYKKLSQYSWDVGVNSLEVYKRSDNLNAGFIINIKNYLKQNYKIEKTFLMGFSQGGGYAYSIGIKNSHEIEGIICFGSRLIDYKKYPWFLSEQDIENGNKLKVFIAHGVDDKPKNASSAKRILKKNKYNVKLHMFEGGHYVNSEAFKSALEFMEIQ
jgi:predicted esterase